MKPGSSGAIHAPRLILLSLVLLAFGLRLYHLDYQSLWRDEIDAILFARRELSGLAPLFVTPGHNGPLYYLVLHLWIRLTGDSEFAVRYLSLVCGVLGVPVVYVLGRRWVSGTGGSVAAFLCATSPYLIWYGQEGKMYALLLLVSAFSTHVYLQALERNRVYLWASYVLLVAASMYVHLLAVLIVPFHFLLFFLTRPRHRGAWKGWLVTFFVLTLPYVPLVRWEIPLLVGPFTTGHQFYSLPEMLTILFFSFSLHAAPHQSVLAIALYVFLLLGGLLLYVDPRAASARGSMKALLESRRESTILGLYLFVPVVCLFLVSLGMPIFTDRYLITVVPPFLLLLACGVVAVRLRSSALGIVCLGLVLVSNLYVVALQVHTKIKSDFRSAAQYVEEDGRGDLMVFLIPQGRPVFDYYHEDQFAWADAPYTNGGMGPGGVTRAMEEVTEGHQNVWFVVTEAELWDSRGLVQEWFESNSALLGKGSFARVDVYLYSLAAEETGTERGVS
ncbi:MAG TPA: glycosyltransferase family 39 protein [Anaerolineae bacterium]|nr:glycosyltransferase family 39 protein [Anaerolineae bacterium]